MPSFGLGKHNNRSRHAIHEQQATGSGAGHGPSPSTSSIGTSNQQVESISALSSNESFQNIEAGPPPPQAYRTSSQKLHKSSRNQQQQEQLRALQQQQQRAQPNQTQQQYQVAQAQQQQQQRLGDPSQQHQHQQRFSQLLNSSHGLSSDSRLASPANITGASGDEQSDGPPTSLSELQPYGDQATPNRSQSQRYSTIPQGYHYQQGLPPHHEHYTHHNASNSVDNLPATAEYQRPETVTAIIPEKKSTRNRLKGLFGGSSSRHAEEASSQRQRQQRQQPQQGPPQPPPFHQQHHQTPPPNLSGPPSSFQDNSPNLGRSSSKKNRNPPEINTAFASQQLKTSGWQDYPPDSTFSPTRDSPLQGIGEVDDFHFSGHASDRDLPTQSARTPLHDTVRQVSAEGERLSQDESHFHQYQRQQQQQLPPPPQQLQPGGGAPPSLRLQQPHVFVQKHDNQQQLRYDTGPSPVQDPSPHSFPQQQPGQQQFVAYRQDLYPPPGDSRANPRLEPQQQHQYQDPESVSQLSHDSPVTDGDQHPPNQPSLQHSPAVSHSTIYTQEVSNSAGPYPPPHSIGSQPVTPHDQSQEGVPPAGGPPPSSRQLSDPDNPMSRPPAEGPPVGPPPGYRHGSISGASIGPPPQPGQGGPPNSMYRGDRTAQYENAPPEPRGSTPQPGPQDGDEKLKDILAKYKNVKRLYFDGKTQNEILTRQIETLQNAVANQRMSQSRTAWDDSEYTTRFTRLNGAIKDLSYGIRRDWRSTPGWLEKCVTADAIKTGKHEMTAVGRAVISRWLMEEIFQKCFHPGLEPTLSAQLKEIELSIRGNAYTMNSHEEFEALTAKVVNWRMATLDGLSKKLSPSEAAKHRHNLTSKAVKDLTGILSRYLDEAAAKGAEGSVSTLIEQAVAIAANLPMESRDVAIHLPLPGDRVHSHLVEIQTSPMPALEASKEDSDSDDSDDSDVEKSGKGSGEKPQGIGTVRFAGFVSVEVRGRQVLMKSPCWLMRSGTAES